MERFSPSRGPSGPHLRCISVTAAVLSQYGTSSFGASVSDNPFMVSIVHRVVEYDTPSNCKVIRARRVNTTFTFDVQVLPDTVYMFFSLS